MAAGARGPGPAPAGGGFVHPDAAEDENAYFDGDDENLPPPAISFSLDEGIHLAVSVFVLAIAFSFALSSSSLLFSSSNAIDTIFDNVLPVLPYAFLIVVTAFVLHELAHKVAAQRRYMWAEYRSSWGGLFVGLLVSVATGVVFASPGAVHIFGRASDRDSGVISIVGPLVNLAIGYAAIPFAYFVGKPIPVGGLGNLFEIVIFVNAFLAFFNMLPIYPLDGSKVWRWSPVAYIAVILLIVPLVVVYLFGVAWITG